MSNTKHCLGKRFVSISRDPSILVHLSGIIRINWVQTAKCGFSLCRRSEWTLLAQ